MATLGAMGLKNRPVHGDIETWRLKTDQDMVISGVLTCFRRQLGIQLILSKTFPGRFQMKLILSLESQSNQVKSQ